MLVPLGDVWDHARLGVRPPVGLLPLLAFLDGGVLLGRVQHVLGDVALLHNLTDLEGKDWEIL